MAFYSSLKSFLSGKDDSINKNFLKSSNLFKRKKTEDSDVVESMEDENYKRNFDRSVKLIKELEGSVKGTLESLTKDKSIANNADVKDIIREINATKDLRGRLVDKDQQISEEEVDKLFKFYKRIDLLVDKKMKVDVNGKKLGTILKDFEKKNQASTLREINVTRSIERTSKDMNENAVSFIKSNISKISQADFGDQVISGTLASVSPELAMLDKVGSELGFGSKKLIETFTGDSDGDSKEDKVVNSLEEIKEVESENTTKIVKSIDNTKRSVEDNLVREIENFEGQSSAKHEETMEVRSEENKDVIDALEDVENEVGSGKGFFAKLLGKGGILGTIGVGISLVATKVGSLVGFFTSGGFVKALFAGLKFLLKNPLALAGTLIAGRGAAKIAKRRDDVGYFKNQQGDFDVFDSKFSDTAQSVGGGALTGAAIGSVVPVIGTLLGAGIGATIGAGSSFLADNPDILKSAFNSVGGSLNSIFESGITILSKTIMAIPNLFSGAWSAIKAIPNVLDGMINSLQPVMDAVNNTILGLGSFFRGIIDRIVSFGNFVSSPIKTITGFFAGDKDDTAAVVKSQGVSESVLDTRRPITREKGTETNDGQRLMSWLVGNLPDDEMPPVVTSQMMANDYNNNLRDSIPPPALTESTVNNSYNYDKSREIIKNTHDNSKTIYNKYSSGGASRMQQPQTREVSSSSQSGNVMINDIGLAVTVGGGL